jgi:hypothetical protein
VTSRNTNTSFNVEFNQFVSAIGKINCAAFVLFVYFTYETCAANTLFIELEIIALNQIIKNIYSVKCH